MDPATATASAPTTTQPEQPEDGAEQADSSEVGVSGDTPGTADLGLGTSCFILAALHPRVLPWGGGFLAFGCPVGAPEWTREWMETRPTIHTSADGLTWSAVESLPPPFADLPGRAFEYRAASDGQRLLLAVDRGDRILVSITGDLSIWDTFEVTPTQPDGLPRGVRAETRADMLAVGPDGWLLLTSTYLGVDLRVLAPADIGESATAIRFGYPESRGLNVEWWAGQEPDESYHTRFVTWEELGIDEDIYLHYGVAEYAMRPHTPNELRSGAVWSADWGGEPVRADLPKVEDAALWTVVGTADGYVGLPWIGGVGCPSPGGETFFSPDGLTWNASDTPGGAGVSLMALSAVENGVVVSGHEWDGSRCNPVTSHLWRGDANASNWEPVELPGLPQPSWIRMWGGGGGAVGMSGLTEGGGLTQWIVGSRNGVDWLVGDKAELGEFSATVNGNAMVAISRQGNVRRFVIP